MKIERDRYLLLVGTLAAGCSPSTPAPVAAQVEIPAAPTAAPLAVPGPADPARPAATSTALAVPPATAEPRPLPAPQEEEAIGPSSATSSKDDGMCRAKTVTRRTGPQCSDDVGAPGPCRAAGGACRGIGFVCDQCEAYKRYFKPKVAERAVACVTGQKASEARDGCKTYQCGDEALRAACLDSTVDPVCKTIATKCKTTVDVCRGLLSGMNAAGRAKVAACAAKCEFGLWSCIEGI